MIVTTKCTYEREVIKRDGPATQLSVEKIKGKCSVLSLKQYCTCTFVSSLLINVGIVSSLDRLTEIVESDVYLCETKYVSDDHSLRNLSKPLKVSTPMIFPRFRLSFCPLANIIIVESRAR